METSEIQKLLLEKFPSYAQKKILLDDLTKRIKGNPKRLLLSLL